jgi:hypothetical protein
MSQGTEQVGGEKPLMGSEYRPVSFQLTDGTRFVAADHRWYGGDDGAVISEARARGNFDSELGGFSGDPPQRTIFIPITSIVYHEAISQ